MLSFGCLAEQESWSDLRVDTGTLFLQDRIQTQLHEEGCLFFIKVVLMSTLVATAGVSDGVTQQLQMPIGPQALEDVEQLMPSRPATLKNHGTHDPIVLARHNLTHVPSQPWCKVCVESSGRLTS